MATVEVGMAGLVVGAGVVEGVGVVAIEFSMMATFGLECACWRRVSGLTTAVAGVLSSDPMRRTFLLSVPV